MSAFLFAIGVLVGGAISYVWSRNKGRGQQVPNGKVWFRSDPGAEVPMRRLDELIELSRAAALHVRVVPGGYDVIQQGTRDVPHVVGVRVADPDRVFLDKINVLDSGAYDLMFSVALALVPAFGAITVRDRDGQEFLVDGTRDQHALRLDKAARVRKRLDAAMARLGAR